MKHFTCVALVRSLVFFNGVIRCKKNYWTLFMSSQLSNNKYFLNFLILTIPKEKKALIICSVCTLISVTFAMPNIAVLMHQKSVGKYFIVNYCSSHVHFARLQLHQHEEHEWELTCHFCTFVWLIWFNSAH